MIRIRSSAPLSYNDNLIRLQERAVSAYSIAREHVEGAVSQAEASGVEAEAVLRALLATLAERYREMKGADDLRAVLQFQLDNAQGDEDHMFMRP